MQMDPVAQLGLLYCWHLHLSRPAYLNTWREIMRAKCVFAGKKRERNVNVYLVDDVHIANNVEALG